MVNVSLTTLAVTAAIFCAAVDAVPVKTTGSKTSNPKPKAPKGKGSPAKVEGSNSAHSHEAWNSFAKGLGSGLGEGFVNALSPTSRRDVEDNLEWEARDVSEFMGRDLEDEVFEQFARDLDGYYFGLD